MLYFTNQFPRNFNQKLQKNISLLGIGGNIGNTKKIFNQLLIMLLKNQKISVLKTSILYKNPPFGYLEQNDFLNSLILISTNLSPFELLKITQRYEKRLKRQRSFKNAPRTIDIDIIFFNDYKINSKNLIIPHKFWHERDSVIVPYLYL